MWPYSYPPTIAEVLKQVESDIGYAIEGKVMAKKPTFTPLMLSRGFKTLKKDTVKEVCTQVPFAIFFQAGLDIAHAYDMEFFFPCEHGNFEVIKDALKKYIQLLKKYYNRK